MPGIEGTKSYARHVEGGSTPIQRASTGAVKQARTFFSGSGGGGPARLLALERGVVDIHSLVDGFAASARPLSKPSYVFLVNLLMTLNFATPSNALTAAPFHLQHLEDTMYTENIGQDGYRFAKALLTNQMARFAPKLYLSLMHETGRGDSEAAPAATADYFFRCFNDYGQHLGLDGDQFACFLQGKAVLEYGPGDVLGVALLMYANGADFVHCVDRFPRKKISTKNIDIYNKILDRLGSEQRNRAIHAFNECGDPGSGFKPSIINYAVTTDGLIGRKSAYDLIVSRAVLEHVNHLESTILDNAQALRPDGVAIHNVDLKSHNLDRYRPFDFLTWPESAYRLMNSHKGRPNRWRVDKYRECVARSGLRFKALAHTGKLNDEEIDRIRPNLATNFRNLPTEELTWLGFWMVLEQADSQSRPPHESSTASLELSAP